MKIVSYYSFRIWKKTIYLLKQWSLKSGSITFLFCVTACQLLFLWLERSKRFSGSLTSFKAVWIRMFSPWIEFQQSCIVSCTCPLHHPLACICKNYYIVMNKFVLSISKWIIYKSILLTPIPYSSIFLTSRSFSRALQVFRHSSFETVWGAIWLMTSFKKIRPSQKTKSSKLSDLLNSPVLYVLSLPSNHRWVPMSLTPGDLPDLWRMPFLSRK